MQTIIKSSRSVLQKRSYLFLFLLSSLLMLTLYIAIPIVYTPGNTLPFFLEITPWYGFAAFTLLALAVGLLITMNIYTFRTYRKASLQSNSMGVVGTASSLITGVFSSATCAACVSALLAFILPPAGIVWLVNYRWHVVALGFLLVLVSLFFTARKIQHKCMTCMPKKKTKSKKS